MKAVKINTWGDIEVYDGPITLPVLQEAVHGYIEPILIHNGTDGAIMYVNEEGKIQGLLPNSIATIIAKRYGPLPINIVGDVILVGAPDSKGDDTTLSDSWINLLTLE